MTTFSRVARTIGRIVLGSFLVLAGVGHLTVAREAFQAQVPTWLPIDADFVVVASGVVEIVLGAALLVVRKYRVWVGAIVALFFVAIFPGNISQFVTRTDSLGLDSDLARGIRLPFQIVLVAWALWCTGAWKAWRHHRAAKRGAPPLQGASDGAEIPHE